MLCQLDIFALPYVAKQIPLLADSILFAVEFLPVWILTGILFLYLTIVVAIEDPYILVLLSILISSVLF